MIRKVLKKLIECLVAYTQEKITFGEISHKIEPVFMDNGQQLTLYYAGKDRPQYKFINEADMAINRSIWLTFFDQERQMNANRETLSKGLSKAIEQFNKQDYASMASTIVIMKDLVDNVTPMDVLFNQAAILYFDKDEIVSEFNGDHHAMKVAAMKAHPQPGFFLKKLLKDSGISSDQSISSILSSLKKGAAKAAAYQRVIEGEDYLKDGKNGEAR